MSVEARPFLALDIDGTICKSSLLEAAVKASIAEGIFRESTFRDTFRTKEAWQDDNNEGTYLAYLRRMVGAFVLSIEGVEVSVFDRIIDSVVREQLKRRFIFPKRVTKELAPTHEPIGISGSPIMLVRPFLEEQGYNHVYGSEYEAIGGRFTGVARSVGSKSLILQTLVDSGIVALSNSVAMGDTMSDTEMFHFVDTSGTAILFNPSLTLRNYGAVFNWDRVNEVKDNITPLVSDHVSSVYREVPLSDYLDSLRPAA